MVDDLAQLQNPRASRFFMRAAAAADRRGGLEHRRRLVAGLSGRVVEVGAGHGPNFALYPPEVTEVVAVEPDATMRAEAAVAAASARVPVTVVAGHADSLPVADGEADAVVFSLVLCMVPQQARTLAEAARVLRHGGGARFYEHVRSTGRVRGLLEDAVTPMLARYVGCHPNRDTVAAVRQAGLDVESLTAFSFGPPLVKVRHVIGAAIKALRAGADRGDGRLTLRRCACPWRCRDERGASGQHRGSTRGCRKIWRRRYARAPALAPMNMVIAFSAALAFWADPRFSGIVTTGSLDAVSRAWVARLGSAGPEREAAAAELHGLLLRAARFEVSRRRVAFSHLGGADLDDLACQSADDALMSILRRLGDFRGDSRFTTWACKFAIVEAGAKVRRHAWRGREIPVAAALWPVIADAAPGPQEHAEARDLLWTVREELGRLTARQREVFVAIALNDVPIDVLAERMDTTRGALYKTLHDARRKLRAAFAAREVSVDRGELP